MTADPATRTVAEAYLAALRARGLRRLFVNAGTDFAPQAPATVFFPAGKQSVSVFVKLLPNAARKRTALFYVVLGNTSSGSALSKASKASISLHP